jgi:tetratricopeptide (TPR) repeat protein
MMANDSSELSAGRLSRLLGYLDADGENLSLLSSAADAALAEQRPQIALDLLARHAALAPLAEKETNLAGLAALQTGDLSSAQKYFEALTALHPDDTSLAFNLAWALASQKRFEEALAVLDDAAALALAQAAMLRVQLLHELGQFDEASVAARRYVEAFPDHEGLLAAVSVLAIDLEDLELARSCAQKAGNHPDALITLGTLALGDARDGEAGALFERAIAANDAAPRAWLGKGLVEMSQGAHGEAARHIERGAAMFVDHIGSWIAAGWAHLFAGEITEARRCFERALALDANFAESHGSLAVLAMFEENTSDAERLTQIALRLDRQCFSAVLAKSMLFETKGKPELARQLIERALNTPIDASGATIAQQIAKRALFA